MTEQLANNEKQFNNLKCHCKPLDALQTPGRLESTSQHAVDNFRTSTLRKLDAITVTI